jgi:1-acyl-sn-glycerol-3-phosphate acyltransferase
LLASVLALIIPKIPLYFDQKVRDRWTKETPHWIARIFYGGIQNFAKFWHRYEIHGIENLSKTNCLLVGYHSRCTVDGVYAQAFLQGTTIMSPIFFAVPASKWIFEKIHCVSTHLPGQSADESFVTTVVEGNRPTILYPGGHHECYKPLDEKYKVMWKELPGYARILLSEPNRPGANTAVVPFFTRNSEEIFFTTDWWYDVSGKMVINDFYEYEHGNIWLLPLLFPKTIAGLGFTPLPRPVKLDLFIGEPVIPKPNETATEFAERVRSSLQSLIDSTQVSSPAPAPSSSVWLFLLSHPLYSAYVFFQMSIFWSSTLLLNTLLVPAMMVWQLVARMIFKKKRRTH